MKKYLYIAIAAAALSSCSSDESLDVQKEAIAFGNPFIENNTRAVDPSYGDDAVALTQFNVWGTVEGTNNGTKSKVSIFKNDAVTGEVGSNVWSCNKTQYWIIGANYNFAAVVNGGTDETKFTYADNLPTAVEFTSTDGQTDLMYDNATTTGAATNSPVNFEFEHMLAKAVFTVTNTTNANDKTKTSNYYYKVSNIKILNPKTTGTCTFASKAWTNTTQADGATYEFGHITNSDKKATNDITTAAIEIRDRADKVTSHRECMLIPYTYNETNGKLNISFDVELYMEVDDNAANDVLISKETKTPSVDVDLIAGYSYSFNITVGIGNLIQFTVTSNPTWTTRDNSNVTVE